MLYARRFVGHQGGGEAKRFHLRSGQIAGAQIEFTFLRRRGVKSSLVPPVSSTGQALWQGGQAISVIMTFKVKRKHRLA